MTTAIAEAPTSATTPPTETFARIPIDLVFRSPTNPRTHFDDHYIAELAESIREKGLIQPIVVRPMVHPTLRNQDAYEIVAGECRWRASHAAGLDAIPAMVRRYSDEQTLEIQLVENIHRTDLTPLEQAAGYRRLIDSNPTKHSAETIAARVGMSPAWVWDRLKLNDLIPEAKQLLESERISVGHAIVIARQKPADQRRIIAPPRAHQFNARNSALWVDEHADFDFDEDKSASKQKDPYHGYKPTTVRELERWITDNIRFDVAHAAQAQPLAFEDTAATVEAAAAKPGRGRKVIAITFDYGCPDGAKDPNERTYGHRSWRFADGQSHPAPDGRGKPRVWGACEYSVLGVVVAGEGQGQTFEVCIAKDKCDTHWGLEIRQRQKNQKLRESGQTSKADKAEAQRAERERKEREAAERKREHFEKFAPALRKAAAEAVAAMKTISGPIYAAILKHHNLPAATKPADILKALLLDATQSQMRGWSYYDEPEMVAWAKTLGVDVDAVRKSVDAKVPAAKKAAAKKGGKKR